MEREITVIFITCGVAILMGILAGSGAVYFFNRMPGAWLCDYGEEPSEELLHPTCQRIKSTPWKYVFTGCFIIIGIIGFLQVADDLNVWVRIDRLCKRAKAVK